MLWNSQLVLPQLASVQCKPSLSRMTSGFSILVTSYDGINSSTVIGENSNLIISKVTSSSTEAILRALNSSSVSKSSLEKGVYSFYF